MANRILNRSNLMLLLLGCLLAVASYFYLSRIEERSDIMGIDRTVNFEIRGWPIEFIEKNDYQPYTILFNEINIVAFILNVLIYFLVLKGVLALIKDLRNS